MKVIGGKLYDIPHSILTQFLTLSLFCFDIFRPTIEELLEHPFFWTNNNKMEMIHNFSELIPSPQNMDQTTLNLLGDFSVSLDAEVAGSRWCDKLPLAPLRPGWGKPPQKPPNEAFSSSQPAVSMIRFIRNIWIHRQQNIQAGVWSSEDEITKVFFGMFPWLTLTLYEILKKHFPIFLKELIKKFH